MSQKEKVKKITGTKKQKNVAQNKGLGDKKNNGCSCGCIPNKKN